MKDHVEIDHLTEYDAFLGWTETKLWTLEYVSNFEKRPPKPYNFNFH